MSVYPRRPVGPEAAAADRLGGQYAEQVKVGCFLVLEEVHLQSRVLGPAEHLEAAVRLDQAHGARYLLIDRVRGLRDGGQGQQFGEDRLGRDAVLASGAPARYRGRLGCRPWFALGPRIRPRLVLGPRLGPGLVLGPRLRPRPWPGIAPRSRPTIGSAFGRVFGQVAYPVSRWGPRSGPGLGRSVPGRHPVRHPGRVIGAGIS